MRVDAARHYQIAFGSYFGFGDANGFSDGRDSMSDNRQIALYNPIRGENLAVAYHKVCVDGHQSLPISKHGSFGAACRHFPIMQSTSSELRVPSA
jgi:hypothetical protein